MQVSMFMVLANVYDGTWWNCCFSSGLLDFCGNGLWPTSLNRSFFLACPRELVVDSACRALRIV